MEAEKKTQCVTPQQTKCHTAVVERTVMEWPIGSPGMQLAGIAVESFDVLAIAPDKMTSVLACC